MKLVRNIVIAGMLALTSSNLSGFDGEQKSDRTQEVKKTERLEELVKKYEGFIEKATDDNKALYSYYELKFDNSDNINSKEVEDFSLLLGKYQKLENFEYTGYYISKLIGSSEDKEFTINTKHLKSLINHLGHENNGKIITINGNAGNNVGCIMKKGTININGNAGHHVGLSMEDGLIIVKGNVGNWLGNDMENGKIIINGNAGNQVGFYMKNGTITVKGNAGSWVGDYMKNGKITINGNAGLYFGHNMVGGIVNINGDYESLAGNIKGGNIYHKGKLIVENGRQR